MKPIINKIKHTKTVAAQSEKPPQKTVGEKTQKNSVRAQHQELYVPQKNWLQLLLLLLRMRLVILACAGATSGATGAGAGTGAIGAGVIGWCCHYSSAAIAAAIGAASAGAAGAINSAAVAAAVAAAVPARYSPAAALSPLPLLIYAVAAYPFRLYEDGTDRSTLLPCHPKDQQ